MITLSDNAQQILTELIAKQSTDHRVKRAFTEADMIELALILLKNMNEKPLELQSQLLLNLSVAQFEIAKS